ncbi:MAG: putative porin, partial [Burkholderiaceae bacterium]
MTSKHSHHQKRSAAALLALTLMSVPFAAHAEERADLEQLRATTLSLIEALVDSGVISRQRADKLIQDADAKAKERIAKAPEPEFKSSFSVPSIPIAAVPIPVVAAQGPSQDQVQLQEQLKTQSLEQIRLQEQLKIQEQTQAQLQEQLKLQSQQLAQLQTQMQAQANAAAQTPVPPPIMSGPAALEGKGPDPVKSQQVMTATIAEQAPSPEVGKDGKKIVRIPYVPESVKREIREQVKQDVLAQSRAERWGEPGALPDWLGRFSFSGDVRLRYQAIKPDSGNTAAGANYANGTVTRAADIVGNSLAGGNPTFNTDNNSEGLRLRARFGVNAKVNDMVAAGMSMTTGDTTNRVSTNQTIGQSFNKYSLVMDKAFLKVDPAPWLSMSGGRIANPYLATDLLWADDLNFEGIALTAAPKISPTLQTFFTAGYFPLREANPGSQGNRDLIAAQAGMDWKFGTAKNTFKLAAAYYEFQGIEGVAQTDTAWNGGGASSAPNYLGSEYQTGFRQRGNTLFRINSPSDPNTNWGLASKFHELDLTGVLDLAHYDPLHVMFIGDYVKNLGFSREEILNRTGVSVTDGKNFGYLGKIQVGQPIITKRGDWNVSLAYRYLGSDAVLDAFTNPDFGLGGTNSKGTILGFNYGIEKNTWISGRWMSS